MGDGPNFRLGVRTSTVRIRVEAVVLLLDRGEFGAVWGQSLFAVQWVWVVREMPVWEVCVFVRAIFLGKKLRLRFAVRPVRLEQVEVLEVTLQVCALLICYNESHR